MPTGSPLLDDYNQTGQMTPGLQRAIDIAKQKLGDQFQFPTASPAQAQPGGMAPLRPPDTTPIPQLNMHFHQAPVAPQVTAPQPTPAMTAQQGEPPISSRFVRAKKTA